MDLSDSMERIKQETTRLLNFVKLGRPYGRLLWEALARLMPGIAFETVLFRQAPSGQTEVYLTLRPPQEIEGGKYHCPGTFIRSGEMPPDVFNRLSGDEYGVKITDYVLVNQAWMREERFPTMLDQIYLVKTAGEPNNPDGKWYPVSGLPENTVDFHRYQIIPKALGLWQKGVTEWHSLR